MTEQEWMSCEDPWQMLLFLRDKASDRKLRLFKCACCRRIWHLIGPAEYRHVVEVAELFSDQQADESELQRALEDTWTVTGNPGHDPTAWAVIHTAGELVERWNWSYVEDVTHTHAARAVSIAAERGDELDPAELLAQAALLRDLFGNPFRPAVIEPCLLAHDAGSLCRMAQTIYEERRFADLPILADALEEAGCTDKALLSHCRGPGPHVRGCWALDLILGKS
jgi:hypothetical protein